MALRALVTSYADDLRLFPDRWHKIGLVVFALLLLSFPLWASAKWQVVGNLGLIFVVGSMGLMVLSGFTGQISLGHAAFIAIGAYTTAILATRYQIPWWLILPIAGCICAIVGVGVSLFAFRLRGLSLAIVTIGLLVIVKYILESLPEITGGSRGIDVPLHLWFGESEADSDAVLDTMAYGPIILDISQKVYYWFLPIAVATVWAGKNLTRSATGRAMMAVRDQDMAANALGVNPARVKVTAFAISSFLGGVAGVMWAVQYRYLGLSSFTLELSVNFIAMVIIGGVGTVFGAVSGAVAFAVLIPLMPTIAEKVPYLSDLTSSEQSAVLFSVLVCVVLIAEPLGLLGIWLRIKRYFLTWPFRY